MLLQYGQVLNAAIPKVTVRFANPVYFCATQTYIVDVEFQCDSANKQLFGMNVRFSYPDTLLEFLSFDNFTDGYGITSPYPPFISTGGPSTGMILFGFPGPQEYINGAFQKNSDSVVYLPTSGWLKIFSVSFHVDDPQAMNSESFCPSLIWDLNESGTGGINPNGGIVITLVVSYPNQTGPALEACNQFNWQYDGIPGLPHGFPVENDCINTICAYAPKTHLPVQGILNPGLFDVPVMVTEFDSIKGFNLAFEYDSATMIYLNNSPNSIFNSENGYLTVTDLPLSASKKKILLQYSGNIITLSDSSNITNLHFSYISGSSDLKWITSGNQCEYIGRYNIPAYDLPFSDYYIDGNIVSLYAPVTKIDSAVALPNDYVTFAVKVYGYNDVRSGFLTLDYNPSVLAFHHILPDISIDSSFTASVGIPGILQTGWTGEEKKIPDGTILLYIAFNYLGGNAPLTWSDNGISCQYISDILEVPLVDSPTADHYINGYITNASLIWRGNTSSDWETGSNWDRGSPPGADEIAIIDPSVNPAHWPVFTGDFITGGECRDLVLNNNSQLRVTGDFIINPGSRVTLSGPAFLEIYGDWVNSGIFHEGQATIEFKGSGSSLIANGLTTANYLVNYSSETFTAGMQSLSGGVTGPSGDNAHLDVNIGFGFNFLGANYTQARINTNGWLSLILAGEDEHSHDNTILFDTIDPVSVLAPWWDDLAGDGSTTIQFSTTGSQPQRIFTAEWKNILSYSSGASGRLNFQVKLYEESHIIEFHYGNMISGTHSPGESASIGLKDLTGGPGHFLEATQNSPDNIIVCLKSETDWPSVNYRFTPPDSNAPERFHKVITSKNGGNILIQKDIEIKGIE